MISHLLTPKTITEYDRNIVHLFSRFNIGSDSTLKLNEICKKDEININLLVDLINCYNDLSYLEKTKFEDYSIIDLIDYLEKSHLYYLEKNTRNRTKPASTKSSRKFFIQLYFYKIL